MADNTLNVSIPTAVNGGTGGLTLNYNFGGSADTIAAGAYNFIQNSYAADTGFLGQSINGTQAFLAHQTAPILSAVGQQEASYAENAPSLFSQLLSFAQKTQSNQMSAISMTEGYQNNIAIDSISASKKASKKGGLCFITTAVCGSLDLPDDNEYLYKLRCFRDNFMSRYDRTRAMVAKYYETAPGFVEKINKRADAHAVYSYLFCHFILPACHSIDCGDAEETLAIYAAMVAYVEVKANGVE